MGKLSPAVTLLLCELLTGVQLSIAVDYGARLGGLSDVFFQRVKRQSRLPRPELKVTDFHVRCSVVSRYASTTVQSSVWNQFPVLREAVFEVDLPSSAFISNFSITSNNKVYVATVKEKGLAKKIYDEAKKRGKTAGLVATKEREMEKFRVAVSVPPGTHMSFSLSYEELLSRRLGRYELVLGLRPGQPVQNLSLEVTVAERTGISFLRALPLRTSRLLSNNVQGDLEAPPSTVIQQSPNCAHVHYSPTLQQQTNSSTKGLNSDFVIQYDVELTDLMGDVQIYDGYFVHYFAPRGLPVVSKDVIFVIDISGSMTGTKMTQTKQAMATILGDLREGDHFNIISFSDTVSVWKKGGVVRATRQNVRDAKEFVKKINAEGWTNINAALLTAAQQVNPRVNATQATVSRRVPMVIFLTDGEATIGVTSGEMILRNARSALGSTSLFCLAFGDDADFPLLRRLSLENRGVARMVYEDADAALQLKGFYDEVASPLLSDIQLSYLDDQAYDVTQVLFPNYFQGSELVVAGRVQPGVQDLKVSVTAAGSKQNLKLQNDVSTSKPDNGTLPYLKCSDEMQGISSFVRRLWAYFTIKELLQAKLNSTDPAAQRLLNEKATNLSLKYNFVTPVTSLVVVKPDIDETPPNLSTTATLTTTTRVPGVIVSTAPLLHTPKAASSTADSTQKTNSTSTLKSSKSKPDPHSGKLPTPPAPVSSQTKKAATQKSTPLPHPDGVPTPTSSMKALFPPIPETDPKRPNESESSNTATPPHLTTLPIVPSAAPPPATDLEPDVQVATHISAILVPTLSEIEARGHLKVLGLQDDLFRSATLSTQRTSQSLFGSSVDGDPHFVVQLPKLDQHLCFTIDGQANDVLRLVEDPEKGIIVDGHLMWAPPKHDFENRVRTYIDTLIISAAMGQETVLITVTLDKVILEGEDKEVLLSSYPGSVVRQGVKVTIDDHLRCWLILGPGLQFLVLFHHYKHPNYLQKAHLGFYIVDGSALSPVTQGLLGQFQHSNLELFNKDTQEGREDHGAEAVLKSGDTSVKVTLEDRSLKDSMRKRHHDTCWVVGKTDVERFLGHSYQSYVVDHL